MIWLGSDATDYSVECEACREDHRWSAPAGGSMVEGSLRREADVGFTTCFRGHRVRVRRIARLRVVTAR